METIEGSGVHCEVTDSEITAVADPSSILQFCCSSGYRTCPVWMAEKERIWAEQRTSLIDAGATRPPEPAASWAY